MPATERAIDLARAAASAAAEVNAEDLIAIDVADRLALTDVFVVASAASERQVRGVVDRVEETLRRDWKLSAKRREGYEDLRWVLLDFGDIVVHVQHEEDREFYNLERLWKDCEFIDLNLPHPEDSQGSQESQESNESLENGENGSEVRV